MTQWSTGFVWSFGVDVTVGVVVVADVTDAVVDVADVTEGVVDVEEVN